MYRQTPFTLSVSLYHTLEYHRIFHRDCLILYSLNPESTSSKPTGNRHTEMLISTWYIDTSDNGIVDRKQGDRQLEVLLIHSCLIAHTSMGENRSVDRSVAYIGLYVPAFSGYCEYTGYHLLKQLKRKKEIHSTTQFSLLTTRQGYFPLWVKLLACKTFEELRKYRKSCLETGTNNHNYCINTDL